MCVLWFCNECADPDKGLENNKWYCEGENLYHMERNITMESQNSDSGEHASIRGRSENFMNYVTLE